MKITKRIFTGSKFLLVLLILVFWPVAIIYYFMKCDVVESGLTNEISKKNLVSRYNKRLKV